MDMTFCSFEKKKAKTKQRRKQGHDLSLHFGF
jgi:hypothetical protein